MSGEPARDGITCPECGTINRPGSVFCAECGTLLPQPGNDAQATASFTPILDAEESWATDDAHTTQLFTPRSDADHPPRASASVWSSRTSGDLPYMAQDPGRRGFVLGLVASILILAVFGFFLWSSVVSQGFRDAITGLF